MVAVENNTVKLDTEDYRIITSIMNPFQIEYGSRVLQNAIEHGDVICNKEYSIDELKVIMQLVADGNYELTIGEQEVRIEDYR